MLVLEVEVQVDIYVLLSRVVERQVIRELSVEVALALEVEQEELQEMQLLLEDKLQ